MVGHHQGVVSGRGRFPITSGRRHQTSFGAVRGTDLPAKVNSTLGLVRKLRCKLSPFLSVRIYSNPEIYFLTLIF